jgi:hypothetical protein
VRTIRASRGIADSGTWTHGQYGDFKVVVDGDTVIDGGAAAFLGVMPSRAKIVAAVRADCRLAARPYPATSRLTHSLSQRTLRSQVRREQLSQSCSEC